MIDHPAFRVEPWYVRECGLELELLAQTESVFALSNGHLGLRGNLDEGEPHGMPGTYLNSVHELRPLPYAEIAYGYPDSGQTMINITNGKVIRLLVDDEPFDVRYGHLRHHERVLDMRAGLLRREAVWESPAGSAVQVRSERMVSFTQRAVAAIRYEVSPIDRPARIVVQSALVANESLPSGGRDPRTAAVLESPLVVEENTVDGNSAVLVHVTRRSNLRVAAAMDNDVSGPDGTQVTVSGGEDAAHVTITADVEPGQQVVLVKLLAYGWSSQRSRPALHDQVVAALAAARMSGWDGLVEDQRRFLDEFWESADVEATGDEEVQQAVRFGLFHVLQAGARAEQRPIPAKGLTGTGYDGHAFWDTETFVLPVLTLTFPQAAADALRWRRSVLDVAVQNAQKFGWSGAAFPWRTITGVECSGYWPAGTAAVHVNADIADAVVRYVDATDDREFERTVGLPLLVATARLWCSLGHHDVEGRFRIDGVTGPDEYSAVADNNIYTNLMAQQNLRAAADAATRYPDQAGALGVTTDQTAAWRDAATAMTVPFDERLGVHAQAEGFTRHAEWDFEATTPDKYPLLLNFPYFDLYRKQVVKQADLVLAMQLREDAFTPEQKAANFGYYEARTVRDSSLSACTQAVIAAEVGHLDLAYDYLREAALIDLQDHEHNTRDGLHIAALAGGWTALVAGFGGLRVRGDTLAFNPRLPDALSSIRFRIRYRGRRLQVGITRRETTYELLEGEPLRICHGGDPAELTATPTVLPTLAPPPVPPAHQPAHRAPSTRRRRYGVAG